MICSPQYTFEAGLFVCCLGFLLSGCVREIRGEAGLLR